MQAWIRRYQTRNGLACASLVWSCLLLGGCSAQKADMARAPDDDRPVATNEAVANIDPSEDHSVAEEVADESEAEDREGSELLIESPVSPDVSKLDVPPAARIAPAPVDIEATGEEPRIRTRIDEPARVELRVDAKIAEDGLPEPRTGPAAPQSSAMRVNTAPEGASEPYELVTVFYATDRKALGDDADSTRVRKVLVPLVVAASITLLLMVLSWIGWRRRLTSSLTVISLLATLMLGIYWTMGAWNQFQQIADPGVRYGNERGTLAYGTCDVTIPATHSSGEIERPSILRLEVREDVAKHVVLQATRPTAGDEFFQQLRTTVASAERSEVFVFVHGYNVTFDGAARRTAQITNDVKFTGAPIFFSWPSQGGLLKYTVDENNVQWAVPHLKQFLIDVTRRSGAKSVNLIAHSMGNRALTTALRELQLQLGEETALFNQIILAAPDIDAEIFRRDLAPALVQSARRVTLYASSNDQALLASKKVHGYARAGDSGTGLVVLPGIETIDVSTLNTSLLGHSYYGSSNPILLDIHQLIHQSLPAAQRPFLRPRSYGGLTYWVFEKMRATATRELPQVNQ